MDETKLKVVDGELVLGGAGRNMERLEDSAFLLKFGASGFGGRVASGTPSQVRDDLLAPRKFTAVGRSNRKGDRLGRPRARSRAVGRTV